MGHLSRKEMEAVLQGGGSVLYNGQTIWQLGQLPTEADLAQGNPEAETAAANALQQQIADLQAQLDRLAAQPSTPTPAAGGAPPSEDPIVSALGQEIADKLSVAGFTTPDELSAATDAQLLDVPGIGDATLKKIRAAFGGG